MSDYQRDCVKGVKNMDNNKPDEKNIAADISDKVKVDTEGTVTDVTEITPEQNGGEGVSAAEATGIPSGDDLEAGSFGIGSKP